MNKVEVIRKLKTLEFLKKRQDSGQSVVAPNYKMMGITQALITELFPLESTGKTDTLKAVQTSPSV